MDLDYTNNEDDVNFSNVGEDGLTSAEQETLDRSPEKGVPPRNDDVMDRPPLGPFKGGQPPRPEGYSTLEHVPPSKKGRPKGSKNKDSTDKAVKVSAQTRKRRKLLPLTPLVEDDGGSEMPDFLPSTPDAAMDWLDRLRSVESIATSLAKVGWTTDKVVEIITTVALDPNATSRDRLAALSMVDRLVQGAQIDAGSIDPLQKGGRCSSTRVPGSNDRGGSPEGDLITEIDQDMNSLEDGNWGQEQSDPTKEVIGDDTTITRT